VCQWGCWYMTPFIAGTKCLSAPPLTHTLFPQLGHDLSISGIWFNYMCDITHLPLWHDYVRRWHPHRHIHCSLMWDMIYVYVAHDVFMRDTGLTYMWHRTHSYIAHDSFVFGTWLIRMWDMMYWSMCHDSFHRQHPHRHIHCPCNWDTIYLYVGHDSILCATSLIYFHDMTPFIGGTPTDTYTHTYTHPPTHTLFSWVGLIICVTWRIHTWDMTRSYVGHDSFHRWHPHRHTHWSLEWEWSYVWHNSVIRGT